MAVPPALPCQRISNFRTIPPTRELEDYSPLRRKLRIGRTLVQSPELRQAARCEIDFEVQPFARRLLSRDPGTPESDVAPLGEKERVLALQPTEIFDYPSPAFVGWMDSRRLTRGEAEGEVDYARRVFLEIVTTYTFEFGTEETLAASALCEEKESACSGLCVLFVAVLRSQGIPARVLAGLNAKTNPPQPRSGRARHAKAEFFAQGVGWVPLDPAAAIRYDKTPERRRFFGNDRGDMITVHLDTEITFQVFEGQRRTRRFLVNPYFRAAGKGNHQDMTHEDSWTVTPMKDGS
jgi:transglutaminase-like putative cysteine protease